MSFYDEYRSKLITPEQAGKLVKSGDYVDLHGYFTAGEVLDREIAKRAHELKNVKVRTMYRIGKWSFLEADNECRSFTNIPLFVGPYEIMQVKQAFQAPYPVLFSEYPRMYRRGHLKVDVGSRQVSPMDEEGYFHFDASSTYSKGVVDASKIFVAEINTNLHAAASEHPDSRVHISEVDYIVEGLNPVCGEIPDPIPTEEDEKIAGYIYNEIRDGSCLQIGFGKVPMAVTTLIAKSDLKDLGIHTEMICDSIMTLYNSGLVTGRRKTIDKGKVTFTIAGGTNALRIG